LPLKYTKFKPPSTQRRKERQVREDKIFITKPLTTEDSEIHRGKNKKKSLRTFALFAPLR